MGLGKWAKKVGQEVTLTTVEGFEVRVRIVDIRSVYGRVELQVSPVKGPAKALWVSVKRVSPSG